MSRLLAYFVDVAVLSVGFSVLTSIVSYLVDLFLGDRVDSTPSNRWGWAFAVGYLMFGFLYWLIGLTIAGSSVGKALLGLRVLNLDGRPLRGRQALVRVIVYPFSFILGLGLIPIVTAKSHRALHDKVARTTVRYDWGDTDQLARSPLTRWLRGKPAGSWVLAEQEKAAEAATSPTPVRTSPATPVPARGINGSGTNSSAANGNGSGSTSARPGPANGDKQTGQ